MKVTERAVVVFATTAVVLASVVVGLAVGNGRGYFFPFSEGVLALGVGAAGAIVTGTRPRQVIGRLLLYTGLVLALAQLAAAFDSGTPGDALSAPDLGSAVAVTLRFTALALLGFLIAKFPDGVWATRTAKYLCWAMTGLIGVETCLAIGLGLAGAPLTAARVLFPFISVVGLTLTVVVTAHLLRSGPVRRRQVGWVLLALGLAIPLEFVTEGLGVSLGPAEGVLRLAALLLFPASIVVAVTRFRLYEIDRIMSRTVSYGLVVVAMVVVYAAVVGGIGMVVGERNDLTTAVATLAAVGVSVPLIARARRWVDRRFFRSRYDSAAVIARVAEDLRSMIGMGELERHAEEVIDEVFAPASVHVWLA